MTPKTLPTKRKKKLSRMKVKVKFTQSCLILCNPMDYTVRGILQVRILEWVAFPFSRGSSQTQELISHTAGRFFTSWGWHQTKKFLHSKRNQQSEKTTYGVGRILNNISDEILILQMYKVIIKFNSKKKNPIQLINRQRTWIDISPQKIFERPTGT